MGGVLENIGGKTIWRQGDVGRGARYEYDTGAGDISVRALMLGVLKRKRISCVRWSIWSKLMLMLMMLGSRVLRVGVLCNLMNNLV